MFIIANAYRLAPTHSDEPNVRKRIALRTADGMKVCFYLPLHLKRILLTILTCPPHILTF